MNTSSTSILLMEDDPGLARLFELRLTRAGYKVVVAADGDEGLTMYAARQYDVIVLDHIMPSMTGIDVIRALRKVGPLPPCIMVTGTGSEQVAVEALKLGASDYVVKDVDGGYLELMPSVVEQSLEKARLQRERAAMEAALRESQRTLATLMGNLPGMAYRRLNDPEWTMEFVSSGCMALTGYPATDLVDNRCICYVEIIHPTDRASVCRGVEDGLRQRQPFQCEYRIMTADGEERWVWEHGVGIVSPNGDISAIEGFITDTTDRRIAELRLHDYTNHLEELVAARTRALQKAQEQLVRRGKLTVLGQMSGTVGHELRAPLAVIRNAAYYLRAVLPEPSAEVANTLDIIDAEIGTANRIVGDLLDFARTGPMYPISIEPEELFASAVARASVPNRVQVVIDVPAEMPPLVADPRQMEQVLVNLITNAYQAMPDGGTLTLRTRSRPDDKSAEMTVTDTGCGMTSETMGQLFEPLFTTKVKGIGLGLALCKHHVEAHGGRIEAASTAGVGTTFTITLPLADAP